MLTLGAGERISLHPPDETDGPSPDLRQKHGLGHLQKAASGPGSAQALDPWCQELGGGSGDCRPPPRARHPSQLSASRPARGGCRAQCSHGPGCPRPTCPVHSGTSIGSRLRGGKTPEAARGAGPGPPLKGRAGGAAGEGTPAPLTPSPHRSLILTPPPRHLLMRQQEPRVRWARRGPDLPRPWTATARCLP